MGDSGTDSQANNGCKLAKCKLLERKNVLIVVLLIISMTSIGGLVWKISQTDDASSTETAETGTRSPTPFTSSNSVITSTLRWQRSTNVTSSSSSASHATAATSSSYLTTASLPSITTKTISTSTMTIMDLPTRISTTSAFQVLKTNEIVYKNYSFLAVQMTVPGNERSVSENWCRDYENLCKQFGRRPTGCGISDVSGDSYRKCGATYSSDMNIGGVLGCSPTYKIASLISGAFPGWTPMPIGNRNTFAFFQCDDVNCQNELRYSDFSLHRVADVWEKSIQTVYTFCR